MQTDLKISLAQYIEKLPALPTSITKIMEVCNDPTTSPADLSKVISLDPVLMGRIMKLINSAYYGLNNQVTSLVRAIIMLGFNTVKNLALSTAILGSVGKTNSQALNMEAFWEHSLSVGVTAKLIAAKRGEHAGELEEYFVAGLLHDIGKVALNNIVPGEYTKALKYAEAESVSLLAAEDHILSCNHTEVGQMIVSSWQLNENLSHAVTHHHITYTGPCKTLVYTICAANYHVNTTEIGFSVNKYFKKPDQAVFDHLRVTLNEIKELEEEIKTTIEKARIFLQLTD